MVTLDRSLSPASRESLASSAVVAAWDDDDKDSSAGAFSALTLGSYIGQIRFISIRHTYSWTGIKIALADTETAAGTTMEQ